MLSQGSLAAELRNFASTGDILIDSSQNVYSINSLGGILQVVRVTTTGTTSYSNTFGTIPAARTPDI
jgi:hypothetical protein